MQNNISDLLKSLESRFTNIHTDLSGLNAQEQFTLLTSHAKHIVQPELLRERLESSKESGKPLVIKYGIDPTGKDIHIGHVVPIILARRFQQMGHKVQLLFGDFTAFIGDPTGRVEARPVLTPEEIKENVSEYTEQVSKFIDVSKVDVVYNSTFYKDMPILELFRIYRVNKLSPLLQREDFRARMEGLSIAEALYPTLMAIDSLNIKPDVELGGNDQLLNFEITVEFMRSHGLEPQSAITTDLLQGTSGDGAKMSKSKGNFISLRDTAEDVFGKVMSLPDDLLQHYFSLLTDITNEEWSQLNSAMGSGELNPMELKKLLGRVLVTLIHGEEQAINSQKEFEEVFSAGKLPEEMPKFSVSRPEGGEAWLQVLLEIGFVTSKREGRELISAGALRILEEEDEWTSITDPNAALPEKEEVVIKLGKRKFAQINFK